MIKLDKSHYIQTNGGSINDLESQKWNVYTLKLKTTLPDVWIFYVGVTQTTVEKRVNTHLTGGPTKTWGCPYVRDRGLDFIVRDERFTFTYSTPRNKNLKYPEMKKIETDTAKRLCAFLSEIQNIYPNLYFLVTGPDGFNEHYLTDEEIKTILQNKNKT